MLTKNINFKNFQLKKSDKKTKNDLKIFLSKNSALLKSLSSDYKNSYRKEIIKKFQKYFNIRVIGMGGSILGTESIYNFLRHKIKKRFYFINNLQSKINPLNKKKKYINLVV